MGDYSNSDSNKLKSLFKKSLGVVSTFKDLSFYNEIVRKFRTPVQAEDVNIENVPTLPDWADLSLNSSAMEGLGFDLGSDDFSSETFTELHTFSSASNGYTYTTNGTKLPGMYLDNSGVIALFVRLKLDKMTGDENMDSSAIVYTKHATDSSHNSLMNSAYQFNYNSQINVNSSIPVFKPYNYTLEYSSDDSAFHQVTNDIGNWSFDTNSGTIIFENDPSANNSIIDLSNGDLYFTFVKYVGLQGIQNLIYYNKDGYSGIGTKNPLAELDVSGSVNITGNLEVKKDLYVFSDTLYVDTSTKRVGINTTDPSSELHVDTGSSERQAARVTGTLSIGAGIGPGMCPIGTIIIWTNTTAPSGYGTWLLCDGATDIPSSSYPDLSNILGSDSGTGNINIPNLKNKYTKGSATNDTSISNGGNATSSSVTLDASNLPQHTHTLDSHSHSVTVGNHVHNSEVSHTHTTNAAQINQHSHDSYDHYHNIDDSATTHNHGLNDSAHNHGVTFSHHQHTFVHNHTAVNPTSEHEHEIQRATSFTATTQERGNRNSSSFQINSSFNTTSATTGQYTASGSVTGSSVKYNTNTSTLGVNSTNGTQVVVDANTDKFNTTNASTSVDTGGGLTALGASTVAYITLDDATSLASSNDSVGVAADNTALSEHETHFPDWPQAAMDFSFSSITPECIEIFYFIRAA